VDENTAAAFEAAIAQGATHIETDVQCSSDGVAMVFHDPDFVRVAGSSARIEQLTAAEIGAIRLAKGGSVHSLAEVLRRFPETRFNIDIKSQRVIGPAARAVAEAHATDRVLITSFSDSRRRATLRAIERLGGGMPATSAGGGMTSLALLGFAIARPFGGSAVTRLLRAILRNVDALQVPMSFGAIRVAHPAFVAAVSAAGIYVHFWVINDGATGRKLLDMGAAGLVSDDLPALIDR
jgi:glycerophosphoryl diester phosphodiesterase